MHKSKKRYFSVVAAGLIAVMIGVVGVSVANGSSSGTSRNSATLPTDLTAAFSALQRPATAADAVPANVDAAMSGSGVNVSDSRLALSTSGASLWIVPGLASTCMVTQMAGGTSSMCTTNASAETKGLVTGIFDRNQNAAGQEWAGILPTGVTNVLAQNAGSTLPVSISSDGGFMQPVTAPQTLSFTDPGGAQVSLPVTPAPPASLTAGTPTCSSNC
jgi:hypothetical protein